MVPQANKLRRAVFLDRDGVLNADRGYVFRVSDLTLLDGVPAALRQLKAAGFLLIVVTNQSGVARGLYTTSDVERFHLALTAAIEAAGGPLIDDYFYCPHLESGSAVEFAIKCDCRKPEPGMLMAAAKKHGIDLSRSFIVGDKADDIEAGLRAGVAGIQVKSSYGAPHPRAVDVAQSLLEAVPRLVAT
jgi:D-glycero-D-manno-heptose 1,7-bisphosphate phosphatase